MPSASYSKCHYTFCPIVCLLWSIMQCGQQKMASRKYSKAWQGKITAYVFSYRDKIMVTVGKSSTHTGSLRIKMLHQCCIKNVSKGACMCIYVQLKFKGLTTHVHVRLLVIGILWHQDLPWTNLSICSIFWYMWQTGGQLACTCKVAEFVYTSQVNILCKTDTFLRIHWCKPGS